MRNSRAKKPKPGANMQGGGGGGGGKEEKLPHLPQSLQSRALGFRSPSPLSRSYLSLRLGIGKQKENAEERENFLQRGNVTGVL